MGTNPKPEGNPEICDRDCFNCKFDDCINDEFNYQDFVESRQMERDFLFTKSLKQRRHDEWFAGYYSKNRDRMLANQKAYKDAHRAELNAKQREYTDANYEECIARSRAWKESHREYLRERDKARYWSDPEKARQRTREYRARKRQEKLAAKAVVSEQPKETVDE